MLLHRALLNRQKGWLICLVSISLLVGLVLTPSRSVQAATTISGPVVVRSGGAQLYDAPDGDVVTTLSTGTIMTATGRTEDELWIVGQAASDEHGWLQVAQVIAMGVELLPVYSGDAAASTAMLTTATPSLEVTPTVPSADTPAKIVTNANEIIGTVASGSDNLNIRSGPGTAYVILAKAASGEQYPVTGRSVDGAWLQIDRGNGETGWVSASYLQLSGDASVVPVVEASSSPPTASSNTTIQTAAPDEAAVSGLSGTLVIESSPGGMIYGYSLDSGALWTITSGFDPAISPDGQTIAFVRDGGENGIYLIDMNGRNERLIFSGRERLSSPKWSPDGQWLVFTRSDDEYHCVEMGGSCIDLPSAPDGSETDIPGAESVTRYWYNLARIDRDGNNYRDIGSLPSARAADWNEAGIVYQSDAGLQITADAPDAENSLVISDYLKPFFNDPDWQPNGGQIVYMGKEASHWELFSVNPDGSGKSVLTRPETTVVDEIPSNVAPAWSPDGQHIVFLSNREPNHEAGTWRVWVMDADGSNQRTLPIDVALNYTFGNEQSIAWAQ